MKYHMKDSLILFGFIILFELLGELVLNGLAIASCYFITISADTMTALVTLTFYIIVAPIVEEYVRADGIELGVGKSLSLTIALFEFIQGFGMMVYENEYVPILIVIRFLWFPGHLILCKINQKIGWKLTALLHGIINFTLMMSVSV